MTDTTYEGTATYSPEDNKLRFTPFSRLDSDLYQRVKDAGFRWAPQQKIFVAPMWTPGREDLLTELCGEIDDEDTSLVDRAEERADRFGGYSDNRAKDAQQSSDHADQIGERFFGGQPILVGHHSEKRARKDHERADNAIRKSIKMWETASYWKSRAAGALRHAKYKELPGVRARRIKKIETDKRRYERETAQADKFLRMWGTLELDVPGKWEKKDGTKATIVERATAIANYDHVTVSFTLEKYPRPEGCTSTYEGPSSTWSGLDSGIITPQKARELSLEAHECGNAGRARWLTHYDNRLTYEKAMLEESGGLDLLKPKPRPKQLPICNYRQEKIIYPNKYQRGELCTARQVEMTQVEFKKIYSDYKGTEIIDNSHRVRIALLRDQRSTERVCVFLTDSKVHTKPEPITLEPVTPNFPPLPSVNPYQVPAEQQRAQEMRAKREAMPEIEVTYADQFYPTPPDVAARMVELADIHGEQTILEPSAGSGNILYEIIKYEVIHGKEWEPTQVTAVEVDSKLHMDISASGQAHTTIQADFLKCNGNLGTFDRIIMNPPFKNAADIKHIQHARALLNPGGKLVAICANGSRQQDQLKPLATTWEELPEDTFKSAGTGVRTVMLSIEA